MGGMCALTRVGWMCAGVWKWLWVYIAIGGDVIGGIGCVYMYCSSLNLCL